MKKTVKKGISVLAVTALLLLTAGCSSKVCDTCGKSYSSGGKTQTIMGEEINMCGDCLNAVNDLANNLLGSLE